MRFAVILSCAIAVGAVSTDAVSASTASARPPPIRIGVLAYRDAEISVEEWAPVVRHLENALPAHATTMRWLGHDAIQRAVLSRELDFVITNPGHYVELESSAGASRILTLQSGAASDAIGSAIITLKNRPGLEQLNDLRGRRVAIVGREAFSGYQIVLRELRAEGIDENQIGTWLTLGLPMDRVLDAVATGAADAGFVRACLIESRPDWQAMFRVLAPRRDTGLACATSTRLYPNWPIATLPYTDAQLARDVTIALLGMSAEEDGIRWTVPADYQAVHAMQRELKIGPYADLQIPTWSMLAQRYWPWVVALLGAIALGGLYTAHVERQVRLRTAALQAALQERELLQERLRESRDRAEHMARLSVLGELSTTLAHELNQPLASIGNYANSLIRRADQHRLNAETTREAAIEVAEQAQRAADILARIRSFARKRAGQREQVDAAELVGDAVALFRGMQVDAPPVQITNRLPVGTQVEVDPIQIQQVLLNLLKNGWDATRGLAEPRQRLDVMLTRTPAGLHVQVRDRGEPVSQAQATSMFEPFFTTKDKGLGLGLAICRSIAEAHGGRLDAGPAPDGPGLVFTLTLPDEHPRTDPLPALADSPRRR